MRNKVFKIKNSNVRPVYEGAVTNFPIAPEWNSYTYFPKGSIVLFRGNLYCAVYDPTVIVNTVDEKVVTESICTECKIEERPITGGCSSCRRIERKCSPYTCSSGVCSSNMPKERVSVKNRVVTSHYLRPDQDDSWKLLTFGTENIPPEDEFVRVNDVFGVPFELDVEDR